MQKFVIRFSQSTLYREMATIKYRDTITHCLWSNYQINDAPLKMQSSQFYDETTFDVSLMKITD